MADWDILVGDCREKLKELPDDFVDAVVTDPPYELGFMGKKWDASGIAYSVDLWREVLRVLKPGGHLLAFGGTRTYHRMTCAIEDAGFEVRDSLHWIYGSGFPKSLNLGDGRGTALKPAHEPIALARKPLERTVAANVLARGTGALNIDACRISANEKKPSSVLKPFWRYYGGKYRAAPRYPRPKHSRIIEPFAGAAGYSLRYPDLDVTLIDSYPVITGIWRYLIATPASEIRRIPEVEDVDDLPGWVPEEARWLVGFWMNNATVSPCKTLSAGRKKLRKMGCHFEGWTEHTRERIATQVEHIRHWKIIEGDFTSAPDVEATWFVDPPYNNRAGSYYVHSDLDYSALGHWAQARKGQVIVCENEGASWLPFKTFATFKAGINGNGSREVIWVNDDSHPGGRWPANILLNEDAAAELDAQSGKSKSGQPRPDRGGGGIWSPSTDGVPAGPQHGDSGGASRFFYVAKTSRKEREAGCEHLPARAGYEAVEREEGSAGVNNPRAGAGRTAKAVRNHHPTVKPIALMRYLVRLVTPPGGFVLDPFAGSGTTGCAAVLEGFDFLGIEREQEYVSIINARIEHWSKAA